MLFFVSYDGVEYEFDRWPILTYSNFKGIFLTFWEIDEKISLSYLSVRRYSQHMASLA